MKLVKIEYLFDDETEELEKEQWRHGLVVQYNAGDEIDTAYQVMNETGDSEALDKVLEEHFGVKDTDIVFYAQDIYVQDMEGLADNQDIIINSTEGIE